MDREVDDIYGDLPEVDLGDEIAKLQQTNKQLLEHIASLEKEIARLNEELARMKTVQKTLEVNISELFKTAKTEIERKDRAIADLRRELDDLILKRIDKDTFYNRKRERAQEYEEGEIVEMKRARYNSDSNKTEAQPRHKELYRRNNYRKEKYINRRYKNEMHDSVDCYKRTRRNFKDRGHPSSLSRSRSRSRRPSSPYERHKRSRSRSRRRDDTKEKDRDRDKSSHQKNESKKNTVTIIESDKNSKVTNTKTTQTNNDKRKNLDENSDSGKSKLMKTTHTYIDANVKKGTTIVIVKEDSHTPDRCEESTTPPLPPNFCKIVPNQNTSTKNIEPPSIVTEKSNTPPPRITTGSVTTNSDTKMDCSENSPKATTSCDNSLNVSDTTENEIYKISTVVTDSTNRPKTVRRRRCVMSFKN